MLKYIIINEYIKRANTVQKGNFVPKWKYDQKCDECENNRKAPEVDIIINGHRYEVI